MLYFKHLLIRDILQFAQQELVMVDLEISTSWPQNALRRWFSTWYFKGCLLILLWVGESSNFSIMEVQDVSTVCFPAKNGETWTSTIWWFLVVSQRVWNIEMRGIFLQRIAFVLLVKIILWSQFSVVKSTFSAGQTPTYWLNLVFLLVEAAWMP